MVTAVRRDRREKLETLDVMVRREKKDPKENPDIADPSESLERKV